MLLAAASRGQLGATGATGAMLITIDGTCGAGGRADYEARPSEPGRWHWAGDVPWPRAVPVDPSTRSSPRHRAWACGVRQPPPRRARPRLARTDGVHGADERLGLQRSWIPIPVVVRIDGSTSVSYLFAKNSSNVRGARPVSSRTVVVTSDIVPAAISA